jgi:hypothetical protein
MCCVRTSLSLKTEHLDQISIMPINKNHLSGINLRNLTSQSEDDSRKRSNADKLERSNLVQVMLWWTQETAETIGCYGLRP